MSLFSGGPTIFVQIASYRDAQLLPTIADCIAKATHPELLRFGICWQRDEQETLGPFAGDPRFRILDYHWTQSQGVCWARNKIQQVYGGETYTLQIDSHHRFASGWDSELITLFEQTGSKKPILTSYAAGFDPFDPQDVNNRTPSGMKTVAEGVTYDGTVIFKPTYMDDTDAKDRPNRARFICGHYYFTLGSHCIECPYDPSLYFIGEEITLTIRSFTHGYDLFHPQKNLIWHEYTRSYRRKHWDDHTESSKQEQTVDLTWHERDVESKKRVWKLLHGDFPDGDPYGFGLVRTLVDYEKYAGVNFREMTLAAETRAGLEPLPFSGIVDAAKDRLEP